MNEAQKILRKELDTIQYCIKNLKTDIELKQRALEGHKINIKDILEALMCLEGEK